jgi:hypothetical protein
MLWVLVMFCAMCVWAMLSLMGSERSRRISELPNELRHEAKNVKNNQPAPPPAPAKPTR